MSRTGRPHWGEEGRAESTAGAWAAAAVVLALGALGFGVASQLQVQDLERRIDSLERTSQIPTITTQEASAGSTPTTVVEPPTDDGSAAVLPGFDREEVETAYETVYDGSKPVEERIEYIDDPTGVVESFQTLSTSELAATAAQLRAAIDQVTFTSTVTATVTYRLTMAGSGGGDAQVGSARLDDGVWKVTRSTVCADLERAGAPCAA